MSATRAGRAAGATEWTREQARPLQEFLRTEAGSASLLLAATLVALIWANGPFGDSYEAVWSTVMTIAVGDAQISEDLRHWVNDGFMVLFFFVVGMEIRRELSMGELTDRRQAAIPAVAALAGMVVPALVYMLVNAGGEGARGWGIVMATDIAFVLGLLSLIGSRAPTSLRVFLLTLAIVDDIGAIAVIAVFYSEDLSLLALAIAFAVAPLILVVNRVRIWRGPAYLLVGLTMWVAMHESGVHPTIAGVIVGVLVAVFPPQRGEVERAARLTRSFRQSPTPKLMRSATLGIADAVSPNERLQALLHPWTSYVVVPIFALANAGVVLDADMLERAAGSPVTLGVIAGLVVGKTLGISLATLTATRVGLGRLPRGAADERLQEEAKVGVLAGSLIAALLATAVFRLADRREPAEPDRPSTLDRPVAPDIDHVRGPVAAPLTLVEYGDYECPFCGDATDAVSEVRARLGDDVRYVFRHLPLDEVHPHARLAAEAAEAAGAQGRFWDMHDLLFRSATAGLDDSRLLDLAQELELDLDRFVDDLQEGAHRAHVDLDVQSAARSGVRGTPTFFVNGVRHTGAWDADTLVAALRAPEH